jgi:hypothetical protein
MQFQERSLQTLHLFEPSFEFAYEQTTAHPKDGLFLYGPHMRPKKTKEIRIGVVGTPTGINYFRSWAAQIKRRVEVPPPGKGEKKDRLHLANFPGIEEALAISFNENDFITYPIELAKIDRATRILNLHEAVAKAVELYMERVRRHLNNEERAIDVWVWCCRRSSSSAASLVQNAPACRWKRVTSARSKGNAQTCHSWTRLSITTPKTSSTTRRIFTGKSRRRSSLSPPTQLLREITLAPDEFKNKAGYPLRRTQDRATIAWNLATGLYYKTQPLPPWKLVSARPGVCYVGLVYKNLPNDPNDHACCAAQMFLSEGDGVVFRGANGPWQTGEFEYHLKPEAAKSLIKKVLDTYREKHGCPPSELFIHGQTSFKDDEWHAFEDAAPPETNVVGVRIRTTGGEMKLFRDGDYPVLRGTALILDERNAYLWTNGYVPQLDTYIGPETPNPLFVTLLRSKHKMPEMKTVLGDIVGLTKINYNSCNFNDSLPVTVRFAKMVGEVLTMGSAKGTEKQPFKYYV